MSTFLFLALAALGAWLYFKWSAAQNRIDHLEGRLSRLEDDLARLGREATASPKPAASPPPLPSPLAVESEPAPREEVVPPAPGPEQVWVPGWWDWQGSWVWIGGRWAARPPSGERPRRAPAEPPPLPRLTEPALPPWPAPEREPVRAARSPINWENFLGVKLFAWLGGLALFLGVAFFVKWSFDQNLITPQLRVALGYLTGLGLLVGGLFIPRPRHLVTVQTLCATGTLVLYANIFASHAYYHFLGPTPLVAFALMALVTATAFLLAVRLDAQVVAILGLLGGFLTPPLLSTGVDNPLGLFGYIALLDIGLVAVALRQRWNHLVLLAAVATVVMQGAWVEKFFTAAKIHVAMAVFLGFTALFVAAFAVAHRFQRIGKWVSAAAMILPSAALVFALYLLWHPYPEVARRPGLLFGYVFLADLGFLALAWWRDELRGVHVGAGGGVFVLLAAWTLQYLTPELLNLALGFYLLFAMLHTVFPVVLHRLRPTPMRLLWVHLYPPLALLLILVPLCKLAAPSFLIWPVVLLIDLVAIALAVITASLFAILTVFVLTVLATALWIFQLPPTLPDVPALLVVIGGFAVFFMLAAVFAGRRITRRFPRLTSAQTSPSAFPVLTPEMFAQIAALAALLPFLLLTLVVLRLPLVAPSPVFGLAALLVALLLGVVRLYKVDLLAPVSLFAVLLLECSWHFNRFAPEHAGLALAWYLGFSAMFLVFPFLFRRSLEGLVLPWVASALALPAHFLIVHRAIKLSFPDFAYLGLVPAALAVPCLFGLVLLVRQLAADHPQRTALLAWFGGATLFFVTLIFPIQFENQWLTLSWALEGVALLWLFHRLPHPGLRLIGVALLVTAFARLALNPAVLDYHPRSDRPILNWYLYSYGLTSACLMLGGRLLAPPRHRVFTFNAPPMLYTLGVMLAFLMMNIEIADAFTDPGQTLTFRFSAGFAQDMTYSLAWALFAFALLGAGFFINNAATRYAGMGLLVVTLLKLFLHDLWQLGGLYRIGSLIGLAVVLILVSFIYQRFLSSDALRKNATRAEGKT